MLKITIYSTPSCMYCQMLKLFLKERNFEFEDVDVSQDEEKAQEMIEKSGQMGVPVVAINDGNNEKIIIGFDREEIVRALGIK